VQDLGLNSNDKCYLNVNRNNTAKGRNDNAGII
jgi:hypothetical protein